MIVKIKKRSAFTLIEIVMVIVILGIVSMIGADIIARMYQGYLRAQVINELQQKTELAIDQIAKRLQYRIKGSMMTRDRNVTDPKIKKLSNNTAGNFDMLEWIGYDNEGFLGDWNATTNTFVPGWSGFIDLNDTVDTNQTKVSTKGSRLDFAEQTILALSYGDISLSNAGNDNPVLIFKQQGGGATAVSFGFDSPISDHNDTQIVRRSGTDVLLFTEPAAQIAATYYEQYYLAWSAYAIVPVGSDNNDFNLTLRYNYQPWHGDEFDDGGTKSSVIAENVSTFRFTQSGNTVRIKLCIQDDNKTGMPIGFCKERAIF